MRKWWPLTFLDSRLFEEFRESFLILSWRWSKETVAVVTGSNKGIGYQVVRDLAKQGLTTVLTARDPARGRAALESLKAEGLQSVYFHPLEVTNAESVKTLAAWLRKEFGGIDILVHNAGIQKLSGAYDEAQETIETNYFGVKNVTKALLPLLRASAAGARILIVSSRLGVLQRFPSDYVKSKLTDAEHLSEDTVDSLAAKYLEDAKAGRTKEEGWAQDFPQYSESKLLVNAYTRVLARSLSSQPAHHPIFANSFCPGGVDTDMAAPFLKIWAGMGRDKSELGLRPVEDAASSVVWLALLPREGYPTGKFFLDREESPP